MPPTSKRSASDGQPLTAAQIADLAGVSIATVSKVLNGRSDVGDQTRRLVEGVINKHGHRRRRRPATAAPLVEVVVSFLGGEYAMQIIAAVERALRPYQLGVVVSGLDGAGSPDGKWMEQMLLRRPAGIISVFCSPTAEQRAQLRDRGIPFVVLDPIVEAAGVPSVAVTNWSGGLDVARHLLELGHRRIGVVTGPTDVLASRARLDGYRAGLGEAGVAWDPALVQPGTFRVADGAAGARALLALPDPPTAIFAFSDPMAVGVYKVAHELGIRIPQQLSVVGYDDTKHANWLHPALTTVRQPLAEMAEDAAAIIVALARGGAPARTRVILATELIVRGSTSRPASAG
jgi:DNA-binding LacI/PurR family transcriptional regulator